MRKLVILLLAPGVASLACSEPRARTAPASSASPVVSSAPMAQAPKDARNADGVKPLVAASVDVQRASLGAVSGHWSIVAYDGAPVDARGTPGTDPGQTATYMAGSAIDIEDGRFKLERGATVAVNQPIVVLNGSCEGHLSFAIGHGRSTMDLTGDGQARLHVDTIPAHDMRLRRD